MEGQSSSAQVNQEKDSHLIIVTGFGPFQGHETVNASWEAVRILPDYYTYNGVEYTLKKLEIPVVYEKVDAIVPEIWAAKPTLVLHCGVHGRVTQICLEKCSVNDDLCRPDYEKKTLEDARAKLTGHGKTCDLLETKMSVERISAELNLSSNCEFRSSTDVGNYLCGYIYLKSLDICPERCLFVHVPPITVFEPEKTSAHILLVMEKCLEDLKERKLH